MFLSEVAATGGFFNLVPFIVFFPVIGMLINISFGSRMGELAIGWIASLASGLSFVISVLLAISLLGYPEGTIVPLVDWITAGQVHLQWAFQVDTLSVTMMLVVSGVGTLIHIYSIGYMHNDVRFNEDLGRYRRFFVFMNLFIAMMMILVSSDSYLMLFVGWEGVGLCSYLLIGFWYEKGAGGIGNAIAAKKAFVTNRIGDFGFLISAFLIYTAFGTFTFNDVFAKAPEVAQTMPAIILAITLFMLLGVTGKSAQLPLFVWLPDAMAGPTPVSALIHAATMVTAGVYLVARSYVLYSLVPQAQTAVALVGGITAFFAATIAVGQFDIKKVLAYSTISQLGYMVAAVGMGAFAAGMFHLITHAFFKALLFLSAGSVIQGMEYGHHQAEHDPQLRRTFRQSSEHLDPQDMRNMGGLWSRMKLTFWVYTIGALALSGVPPLAGFWSKDEILGESFSINNAVYWLLALAAFLTAFYMGRQIFMVFFGDPRTGAAAAAKESAPVMTVPLAILAALSLFGGILNFPGIHSLSTWLEHTIASIHPSEFNLVLAGFSAFLALLAIFVSWWIYVRRYQAMLKLPLARRVDDPLRKIIGPIFTAVEHKWWVDELYSTLILNPYKSIARLMITGEEEADEKEFWEYWVHEVVMVGGFRAISDFLALIVDLEVIDATFNGLAEVTRWVASKLRRIQTGYVRNYALSIFLGVVIIVGYLLIRR
jgi:NADH-quinone oxidoreductase subunit L